MTGNPLGPFFQCYPDKFFNGVRELNESQMAFYPRLVFLMYDHADAIYLDDVAIGKMANSNVRKWRRVKRELLAMGKLHYVPGKAKPGFIGPPQPGLVNIPTLREMLVIVAKAKKSGRHIPSHVIERLVKLTANFGESFAEHLANIARNANENNAPKRSKRIENQNPDSKINNKSLTKGAVPSEVPVIGSPEMDLFNLIQPRVGQAVWASWFTSESITLVGTTIHPKNKFIGDSLESKYGDLIKHVGYTIGCPGKQVDSA